MAKMQKDSLVLYFAFFHSFLIDGVTVIAHLIGITSLIYFRSHELQLFTTFLFFYHIIFILFLFLFYSEHKIFSSLILYDLKVKIQTTYIVFNHYKSSQIWQTKWYFYKFSD